MIERMNILIACEESQAVCIEMRRLGHRAFSCDIIECSGGHPEWHIMQDVLPLLNGRCSFRTMDGKEHKVEGKWDMIIAHPPCTFLTLSGNRWFNVEKYGEKAVQRLKDREEAVRFFMAFINADCDKVAVENPIGIMSSRYRPADQIVQPWEFAINEEENTIKSTCLWLKGLRPLVAVHWQMPEIKYHCWVAPDGREKRQTMWYYNTRCLPRDQRARAASKTFLGIARAMAEQWAGTLNNDLISRSELLRQIRNSQKDNPFQRIGSVAMVWHNVHAHVCSIIDAQEGSDAEPVRHGRWEPVFRRNVFGEHYVEWHACSICKELALSRCENYMDDEELSNYCPNCGAKMTDGDV